LSLIYSTFTPQIPQTKEPGELTPTLRLYGECYPPGSVLLYQIMEIKKAAGLARGRPTACLE